MKLYYSPGACSLGIHVILEEIGKPYETHRISMPNREQYTPEFVAMNPKSKVPTLLKDDGSVLTEFGAIAGWLAYTNRDAGLVPEDNDEVARVWEAIDYIAATVHMQGFTRIARPENFSPDPATHDQVKARGREIYGKGLALLDTTLGDKEWLVGSYSIADAALFYVANWHKRAEVELPANIARHNAAMRARPAVQRVLDDEGLPR